MLACVCQPSNKVLYKCGTDKELDTFESKKYEDTVEYADVENKNMTQANVTLINVKNVDKIKKKAKIRFNPAFSDSVTSSDESKKSGEKKWKSKKRKIKLKPKKLVEDIEVNIYETTSSMNCFKSKKRDVPSENTPSKDNCRNENNLNKIAETPVVEESIVVEIDDSRELRKPNSVVDRSCNTSSGSENIAACRPQRKLGEGVHLTLGELRAMALRQQQQIDTQHQLLAAKEQRLRYLKQQEAKQHQVALEGERLRRLRERVEAQELKLRKLRALRGQVDRNKQVNIALTSDLESIRALFNEKEKELSLAVAKVEELTRQLEELRNGRNGAAPAPPAASLELDKLRRELMYRNKLNEQQNGRLSAQRSALGARQEEMRSIDRRVSELQARLLRKRALNRQLAVAQRQGTQRPAQQPAVQLSNYPSSGNNQNKGNQPRGNVAAVEPFNHIPHAQSVNQNQQNTRQNPQLQPNVPLKQQEQQNHIANIQKAHFMQQQKNQYNGYNIDNNYLGQFSGKLEGFTQVQQGIGTFHQSSDQKIMEHITKYVDGSKQYSPNSSGAKELKINEQEFLPEFAASKSDPKYQTLPYNTKFPTKKQTSDVKAESEKAGAANVNHMTVHSTPLSIINKGLATPLSEEQNSQNVQEGKENKQKNDIKMQNNAMGKMDNLIKSVSSSNSSPNSSGFVRPISSVAPTTMQIGSKPSPIYQTSSTKIQPVQPQTVNKAKFKTNQTKINQSPSPNITNTNMHNNISQSVPGNLFNGPMGGVSNSNNSQIVRNTASGLSTTIPSSNGSSLMLSPPQSTSTPLSKSDVNAEKVVPKPALPPKPPNKTSSRSTHEQYELTNGQSDSNESDVPSIRDSSEKIIKAKPLNLRKAPLNEQPRLRNSRRIEMPPACLLPEMDHLKEPSDLSNDEASKKSNSRDELDKIDTSSGELSDERRNGDINMFNKDNVIRRSRKGNLKQGNKTQLARRVSFDPLALLLDASLEGELELVKNTASKVPNPSAANDEGITALHNAICAGHFEIVKFLVEFGCDVNAQDSDGWTPLHCAASCNNLNMVRFLLDHGACIFATTLSDTETAAEKCEEDEEGYLGCSEYLYSIQEKLGIMNGGQVYGVFSYKASRNDELSFNEGDCLTILRKGDDNEREWWWARDRSGREGYVPRNLLGLYPRVTPKHD